MVRSRELWSLEPPLELPCSTHCKGSNAALSYINMFGHVSVGNQDVHLNPASLVSPAESQPI
jgi:hypothetical protein